ncbi:hypothetical protein L6164_007458 [Bauhinia variegata]|uniref:Uncharacterized protein n=1 Tax=Bauhinia variegata TaxID=167791 RepID=A0ACB9PDK2_BAUVA|nr:hypothetical protein L6164_007458 [Bauhinia variegata]
MGEPIIRIGIIGCADIARKVSCAIALATNAKLHAVGSRALDKAQNFAVANSFPHVKIYRSYEAVLDDPDVDAVYVPLSASLHVHWAVLAAHCPEEETFAAREAGGFQYR